MGRLDDHYIIKKLPKKLIGLLYCSKTYVDRLVLWKEIISQVSGATRKDSFTLFLSLLCGVFQSLRHLERWKDPVSQRDVTVKIDKVGLFLCRARTDDLYHVLPTREEKILGIIQETLKSGDLFVDAGANIGFYTILASRLVGPKGRILSVEMVPETARALRKNISLNKLKNIVVIERAITDSINEKVYATLPTYQTGQASLVSNYSTGLCTDKIAVLTTTLDELLKHSSKVALVKMDLEGAEQLAINGATRVLQKIGGVIFEDWGGEFLKPTFERYGFQVVRLDASNSIAWNKALNEK